MWSITFGSTATPSPLSSRVRRTPRPGAVPTPAGGVPRSCRVSLSLPLQAWLPYAFPLVKLPAQRPPSPPAPRAAGTGDRVGARRTATTPTSLREYCESPARAGAPPTAPRSSCSAAPSPRERDRVGHDHLVERGILDPLDRRPRQHAVHRAREHALGPGRPSAPWPPSIVPAVSMMSSCRMPVRPPTSPMTFMTSARPVRTAPLVDHGELGARGAWRRRGRARRRRRRATRSSGSGGSAAPGAR